MPNSKCSKPPADLPKTEIPQCQPSKKFDPYDYGMQDGYGFGGAVVHIIRLTFGAGILLLPYTMKTTGYVTGTCLLLVVAIFYYHILHILISQEYRLCKFLNVKQLTYTGLVACTFENAPSSVRKIGPFISKLIFIYFCMTAYNSTYLLVFAHSIQNLLAYVHWYPSTTHIITATMIPLIIFCMFRRLLKFLVPFSAASNFFSLVMAVVLVICCVIYRQPNVKINAFGDLSEIPQTIALYVQAFICTNSILPVKSYMKEPRMMSATVGALNVSAATLIFLFTNFALITYFCYGENVDQNILSNLPEDNPLSFVIYSFYAFAMVVIYVLWFSVIFDNVWPELEPKFIGTGYTLVGEYSLRIALNVWSYLLAVGIPDLALILTISGTFGIALEVGLIPVLELVWVSRKNKRSGWIIFKDVAIVVICAALFYMSIVDCIKEVSNLYST